MTSMFSNDPNQQMEFDEAVAEAHSNPRLQRAKKDLWGGVVLDGYWRRDVAKLLLGPVFFTALLPVQPSVIVVVIAIIMWLLTAGLLRVRSRTRRSLHYMRAVFDLWFPTLEDEMRTLKVSRDQQAWFVLWLWHNIDVELWVSTQRWFLQEGTDGALSLKTWIESCADMEKSYAK